MKFQRKQVQIEATQWFKPGDSEFVKDVGPSVIFDRLKNYFYISHFDKDVRFPDTWLAVDPEGEVAEKNGLSLPFAFYELRSGAIEPAEEHPDLLARYAEEMRWDTMPRAVGKLEGGYEVTPGDWIAVDVYGAVRLIPEDVMAKEYEVFDG